MKNNIYCCAWMAALILLSFPKAALAFQDVVLPLGNWRITNFNDDIDRGTTRISNGRIEVRRAGAGGNGGSQGAVQTVRTPVRNGRIHLSFMARADYRSVRGGNGDNGTENPIAVRLVMEDDQGRELLFTLAANYGGAVENKDYWHKNRHIVQQAVNVRRREWTRLSADVGSHLPEAVFLKGIQIIGSGWDFEGAIDDLSVRVAPAQDEPRHDRENAPGTTGNWRITNFNDDIDRGSTRISNGRIEVRRAGAGGNGGSQGAVQTVRIPVRNGRIHLSFMARADYRSVRGGNGDNGTENPIAVRLVMEDDQGRELLFTLAANYGGAVENKDYGINGKHIIQRAVNVRRHEWTRLSADVGEYLPEAVLLKEIQVIGSGWDFEGAVENLQFNWMP